MAATRAVPPLPLTGAGQAFLEPTMPTPGSSRPPLPYPVADALARGGILSARGRNHPPPPPPPLIQSRRAGGGGGGAERSLGLAFAAAATTSPTSAAGAPVHPDMLLVQVRGL